MTHLQRKNDFGTPHCRVIKTVEETKKGEYRLRVMGEDIGLENSPSTFGYSENDRTTADDVNI